MAKTKDVEKGEEMALKRYIRGNLRSLIAIVLSVVVILVEIPLIITILRSNHKISDPRTQTANNSHLVFACIPCDKLLLRGEGDISGDPLLRKLIIKVKDGKRDCCATTSEQLSALLEIVADVNRKSAYPLPSHTMDSLLFRPISVEKKLCMEEPAYGPNDPSLNGTLARLRLCEHKADTTQMSVEGEHHQGVDVLESGLKTRYGGLYYIYASFQFKPRPDYPCKDFSTQTFSAQMVKVPSGRREPQKLLETKRSCHDMPGQSQDVAFTGGVFILQPGDMVQVKVKVAGFELVETSYAGLVMLGGAE